MRCQLNTRPPLERTVRHGAYKALTRCGTVQHGPARFIIPDWHMSASKCRTQEAAAEILDSAAAVEGWAKKEDSALIDDATTATATFLNAHFFSGVAIGFLIGMLLTMIFLCCARVFGFGQQRRYAQHQAVTDTTMQEEQEEQEE